MYPHYVLRIDVHTRRVGGAYGIKLSRSTMGAVAAALVVQKLNRPCRFIQSLTTNTKALGKRLPCASDFEVSYAFFCITVLFLCMEIYLHTIIILDFTF